MNRSFEEEYKKYADIDTPDLWSRIEAGVNALEENKVIDITSSPKFAGRDNESKNDNGSKKGNLGDSRFAVFARRYGGMVAAVACGVAVLSAMGISKLASKSNYSAAPSESAAPAAMAESSEAAYDNSADIEEAYYEAEEAVESYDDSDSVSYAAEAEPEEAVGTYGLDAEAAESFEEAVGEAAENHYKTADIPQSSAAAAEAADEEEERSDSLNLDASKGADAGKTDGLTMKVTARLVSISGTNDGSDASDNGLTCMLKVSDQDESSPMANKEITATVDAAAVKAIEDIRDKGIDKTKLYEVTLTYKDGGFILIKIE